MNKKFMLLILLLSILVLPFSVKADENDVKIEKVELIEKSESTEIVEEPTFSLRKANFNLIFSEVGDYAKYKITLKNEGDVNYEISNQTKFSDNNYIKYEFTFSNDSRILKAKETKEMYISFSYNKKVSDESFNDGEFILNNLMSFELINDSLIVIVPNTYLGYSISMIAIAIVIFIFFVILFVFTKNKKIKILLIVALALLPLTVYALQKISLEIVSKIEIKSGFTGTLYSTSMDSIAVGDLIDLDIYADEIPGSVYLKHNIVNNKVKSSEACLSQDGENELICLNANQYSLNQTNLNNVFTGCYQGENTYSCSISINNGLHSAITNSDGSVITKRGNGCGVDYRCLVNSDGWANCGEYRDPNQMC